MPEMVLLRGAPVEFERSRLRAVPARAQRVWLYTPEKPTTW
jgi:hypothetical protein